MQASDIKENWMMQYYLQKFTDLDGSNDTVTEQIGCDWLKGLCAQSLFLF